MGAWENPTVPEHGAAHAFEQVPSWPGMPHVWHAPLHTALQQNPSAQKPDTQSAADEHVAPMGAFVQPPAALHINAHSSSGSVPLAVKPQAPSLPLPFFVAEQARHVLSQASSQQTPSVQ